MSPQGSLYCKVTEPTILERKLQQHMVFFEQALGDTRKEEPDMQWWCINT